MNAKYFENIPRHVQLPIHQEQTIFTLHFWEICLLDFVMAEEEALVSFCISLPSGQSTTISLPAGSTVAALKEAAQEAFQQGWLRLATADGRLLDSQQKWMKICFPFSFKKANTFLFFQCFLFQICVCMVGTIGDLCVGTQGRMCASLRCSHFVGPAPNQCFCKA